MAENNTVLLVTQRDPKTDKPQRKDLYDMGCEASILQLLRLPDGTVKVLIEGKTRIAVTKVVQGEVFLSGAGRPRPDILLKHEDVTDEKPAALLKTALQRFEEYVKRHRKIPNDVFSAAQQLEDVGLLVDSLAAHIMVKLSEKQMLLEEEDIFKRLEQILKMIEGQIGMMETEKTIRTRVKSQIDKNQRDYYLNEQIKAIQRELNDGEEDGEDIKELEEKLKALKLPDEVRERADKELKKLKMMNPMAAESTVVRNYLEWITELPWSIFSRKKRDLRRAKKVLDTDHYGLDKVKDRILEHIAVQARTKKNRGPILCFVGAPGVGKTSLGKSIARATGREFVRIALGGVRDESEIRGHRRTYIGALPGKILQGMKKAKTSNPVFMLDEIDKLGQDFRGDPASALLEVLDPEQNDSFNDHYLGVDYDLSDVMFICTANTLNMPRPLMDRMEIINISGYTEDEKLEIAKRHLLPKQTKDNGLKKKEFTITDAALRDLIRYYTQEAGVRALERELSKLCRKVVKNIMMKKAASAKITPRNLKGFAGVRRHRFGEAEVHDLPGITTGLAWTQVGGDILVIEAVRVPGKDGTVSVTGKLGDVMKESVKAAEMLIKSRTHDFGIDPKEYEKTALHIHVPEGATPKDGPSAGIAMVTSIISTLTSNPVRRTVAMTGEITLRGRVLPIGGLKEKLLAAHRAGIKKVVIPKENEKDLEEIPKKVTKGLEIVAAEMIDDVLKHALVMPLSPISENTENDSPFFSLKTAEKQENRAIRH